MRLALAGSTGFVGSHLKLALSDHGCEIIELHRSLFPDVHVAPTATAEACGALVAGLTDEQLEPLADRIASADIVVNAAGAADPDATAADQLLAPNVLVPLMLQRAAAETDRCTRFIHISSAAVQGSRRRLDESPGVSPHSPYASTKAWAEQALMSGIWSHQVNTSIYRATSVQGLGRPTTNKLARAAKHPLTPRLGDGSQCLPLTDLDSVASAIATLTFAPEPVLGIVLHPWEGVTQQLLLECGRPNRPRLVVPAAIAMLVSRAINHPRSRIPSKFVGAVRRLDLLITGQEVEATKLISAGFLPASPEKVLTFLREEQP